MPRQFETTVRAAFDILVIALFLTIAGGGPAYADIKDYEFQLVDKEARKANGAVVAVRLIDRRSGKAVPDAVIFARRIDMSPDGMATMTAPLEPLPSTGPGIYRFKTNLTMEGGWLLSLAAKIQGETGTLDSKLLLKVLK